MLVPDSKSMPKLMPIAAIAIAPAARIVPDIEKNQRESPVKSTRQRSRSFAWSPTARFDRSSRPRAIEPRIAEVAITAVNSETSVPTPRVNAKPFTPAVASMNRMNATPIVTTFASMIVRMPFE